MNYEPFPVSYILDKVHLTWSEILWGYEHGFLGWSSIVELAVNSLIEGSNNPSVISLAGLTKQEEWKVGDLLKELCANNKYPVAGQESKKWLYLTLDWIYTNLDSYLDPLAEVEEIYADFDYPQEISQFVRYMPVTDSYEPSEHTPAENEQRLYTKWREYLAQAQGDYPPL